MAIKTWKIYSEKLPVLQQLHKKIPEVTFGDFYFKQESY